MERIIRGSVTARATQTHIVLSTMRYVCSHCLQKALVEFVRRRHEARRPSPLSATALAWTWAERCTLEVIGARLSDWNQAFYWHELDTLTTRHSVLLNVTSENIHSYKIRELIVVTVCLGELMKVYEQEPDTFWRLHQHRSEALVCLGIKLPAYGAELN